MNKIIKTVGLTLIGAVCFSGGLYYGIERSEVSLERVMEEYEVISDKVDAFEKAADPKSIRLYVKELNKILDDTKVLHKIIETGQMGDEALSEFFSSYDKKIDNVNDRILELNTEHMELVFKFKEQVTRLTEETDDNLELIQELQKNIQEQTDYVNKLNVELGQSITQLEEDMSKIKSSTYWLRDKKIWSK